MISTHKRLARRTAPALALAVLSACGAGGMEAPTPQTGTEAAAMTITAADMAQKIGVLAHDSMAGRDTPSPELETAAEYIAEQLRAAGLQPAGQNGTFFHRYDYMVTEMDEEETTVRAAGSDATASYGVDYFMVPPPTRVEAQAYYMGVAGEAPVPPQEARGKILVYQHPGGELNQEWQARLGAAIQPAMMSGSPAVVVILGPDFPPDAMPTLADVTAAQSAPFGVVGITHEAGARLLSDLGQDLAALEAAGSPTALGQTPVVVQATRSQENHRPPNVAAMLRGSDPQLADTYIVVTAHFDHVGVGEPDETGDSIFNGADDDASGTAAVMELAEAFGALDQAPARSVVFLLVSGEEDGLLGSQAWVANPTVDIGSVVANVNMDMVGRNAPDTVIGIGQEYTTLEQVVQEITTTRPELGLEVVLDPVPEEMYFFRSDQLPFIQRGIPAVFFTTGDHEDYHEQSDEVDKIDNDKAARVARLAFYLAHAIAMNPEPPAWTEDGRARVEEMLGGSPF